MIVGGAGRVDPVSEPPLESDLEAGVEGWLGAIGARPRRAELTTVGVDEAVVHHGVHAERFEGLEADTVYEWGGFGMRTLPARGELLTSFATVNDVHFGEQVCGLISGADIGPVFRSEPGEDPYPEVMNRGAVAEMVAREPTAVVVKGDLTARGTVEEYDAFRALYEPAFGDRLMVVRGNHESFHHARFAAEPVQLRDLPGVRLAVLDTSIDGAVAGTLTGDHRVEPLHLIAGQGHSSPGQNATAVPPDRNRKYTSI